MSEIRDIPAFPCHPDIDNKLYDGMTLRDYFAKGMAQGLLNNGTHPNMYQLARDAYALADALLVVRAEDE